MYKDLSAHVLDVAYEAKDVIDSIIVRDNGLLHVIFSLPITIKKVRFIKEDVSQLPEKNPKNKSLIVVNSPKNPVERKSLTTGKILVGFKVETNWLICKLTNGLKDLYVISITVGQEHDEKKLLMKVFNQVTGDLKFRKDIDVKFRKDIDVADMLRKHLIGKRYLIVLDDVWDTTTWDELTRPFPKVEKGSRIIFTTRQKEVALHGKCYTDPLNLRLLKPEESWELLEKRAFGKESCPDELLNVGKEIAQNCKGLPLVADLIAGVIAGREKTKSEVDVRKVIGLSYDHLPHHLKPYFLCLARYPKDSVMDRDVLKAIWRAEGLGEQTGIKSVEEVMEVYLDNLISSSLVIAFNDIAFESSKTNDFGPSLETNWSWDFHFPSNLKILKLCDFPLISDSLSTIARLPNLKELFFITTIIKEEEWNMGEEDTFLNLKYLGLNDKTLAKWEFGEESFPVLEKLALWECRKLTKIPPNFGDSDSLKNIELIESPQLEDSALKIKQYVEDITGVDKLQILDLNNIPLSKTGSSLLFCFLGTKFTRVVYNVFDEFSNELSVNVK
ncbi:hypothetical protein BC332_33539 [Capsicum chinense]|nr:hypothetical protein BC332_33539 [Capsicum chinense]